MSGRFDGPSQTYRCFILLAGALLAIGFEACRRAPEEIPAKNRESTTSSELDRSSARTPADQQTRLPVPEFPQGTGIDFSWIPADAVIVAQWRVSDFRNSPIMQQILGHVDAFPVPGGVDGQQSLETFTFVARDLSPVQDNIESSDIQRSSLLLMRSETPVDLAQMKADEMLEHVTEAAIPLFRKKNATTPDAVEVLAVPEPNLLITGPEELVQAALAQGPSPEFTNGEYNSSGQLHIWIRPQKDHDLTELLPPVVPTEAQRLAALLSEHGDSLLGTLDLTVGAKLNLFLKCHHQVDGQKVLNELQQVIAQVKKIPDSNPAGFAPLEGIVRPFLDSLQATQDEATVRLSAELSPEATDLLALLAKSSLTGRSTAANQGFSLGPDLDELRSVAIPATSAEGLPEGIKLVAATRWDVLGFTSHAPRPTPQKLELVLLALGGSATEIVAVRGLSINPVKLASGERLKQSTNSFADRQAPHNWRLIQHTGAEEQPRDGMSLVVPFHHPPVQAESVSTLSGQMTLRTAGRLVEKQIPNLIDWIDNPVPDEDLQNAGMSVRRVDEGIPGSIEAIQITLRPGALLQDLSLGDPDSLNSINGYIEASLHNDGHSLYTIHLPAERLPDVLPVHCQLATVLIDHEISFQFQDLPIPQHQPLTVEEQELVTWKAAAAPHVELPGVSIEAQARWSLTVGFDAEGNPTPRPLEVAIDLVGEPATHVVAFGKQILTSATTDVGDLALRQRGVTLETEAREKLVAVQREYSLDEYPPDGVQVVYTFDPPEDSAKVIGKLSGQFTIVRAKSQRETTLRDLLTASEAPVSNQDLEQAGIRLKLLRYGDHLTVTMLSGVPESIESIQLVDDLGDPLPGVFGSRSTFGGAIEYSFQSTAPLPERAHMQVTLNEGLEYNEILFDFQNLPIPTPLPTGEEF